MSESLKSRIQEEMKIAMRAREKERVGTTRLIMSEIKQIEVDQRIELDDSQVIAVLDKMLKQRRDSISQFEKAERDDLVAKERAEVEIIQTFLPAQLTEAEIIDLIRAAVSETGAESARDMGKVMGILKPQLQGRADMKAVSGLVKSQLG